MRYKKVSGVIMNIVEFEKQKTQTKANSFFNDFKKFIIITTCFILGANFIGYCQLIITNEIEYFVSIFFIGMLAILWYAFIKYLKF